MVLGVEVWPSLAEFYIYDETIYRLLAGDSQRNAAYRKAFKKTLNGKTVVEIGPGSELVLSRLCLEAGAQKVYAIELLEETYLRARQQIASLGLEDRITLIHGDARRVELPEKVDYCVSEIVGPIGGAEGSARIIEDCRRFLHDPANMLPARTLTRIAAVDLPEEAVSRGFSEIGMHYAEKTFEQLGYRFDLRVCLKHVTRNDLLSTSAVFEDLDYQIPNGLEARHEIELEFLRPGSFTGFLVWLELFVDREEVLDVLDHQTSWLPIYFPVSLSGVTVAVGDRFTGTVTRTLSANGMNPDYAVHGVLLRRGSNPLKISYSAPHFEKRFRGNEFYRKLFPEDEKSLLPAGPPRSEDGKSRMLGEISIPRLFVDRVEEMPDRVALIHGCLTGPHPQWTYKAIHEKSNQLAHLLVERGVGPEVAVAVFLDRSPESVIALLAIFKAGGVYVPLDLSYPAEHIRFIVEESQAKVVLTEQRLAAAFPLCSAEILCVDGKSARQSPTTDSLSANPASLDQLALILYTSGSTGKPKGVASPYRQLINRFEWLWESYPFREGERVGQRTSVSFIPSVWGMLGALLKGTPTVILPNEVVRDPARLIQVLAEERITRIDLTPSLLKTVLDETPDLPARLPHLKLWFTAGEALTVDMYERFRKTSPAAALSNDYGSTEVSGVLAFDSRWTDSASNRVPVGRPIANCSAYILDDRLRPVSSGEIGELYIGGMPVSRGYLSHPDWTAEKFIPDPFSDTPGARLYNMGDLARLRSDGLIELHGRRDHQLKIRGIRVELDGIEAALWGHPAVRECAAGAYGKASGEQELVAFAALKTPDACSPNTLLEFLREKLPEAMMPARLMLVEALPRTASGKVDRTKLSPQTPAREMPAHAADRIRRSLRELVAEVLERPPLVDAEEETSFPRLGVSSVAIVDLAGKISQWMGRKISVTELFDHFSVQKLAEHLAKKYGAPVSEQGAEPAASPAWSDAEEEHAIAIVGYSGRFPGAPDCETFWSNLERGVDAIREVPRDRWDAKRFYDPNPEAANGTVGKWGGFLDDADQFDPLFFNCSPREARWMDPQQRLFLEECWKALEIAGYPDRALSGRAVGVFAGVRSSDYLSERHGLQAPLDALTLLGNDSAILASRVSHFLNLKGPSLSIDTSCSSSLTAVHQACGSLRDGECEMAIAGGVCVITAPDFFVQATKAGMLSKTGRCRTFDRDADGFAPGEGSGVVILKTLARARRDNDTIHGVIRAIGINQDGNTGGLTVPNTLSQCELEKAVYREAGINPETIGYVEAHGTGTRLGDPIEVEALTKAFGEFTERKRFCRIGSVKENIGHLAAAAGVAGLIKVLLALRHQQIPPNVHVKNPNPAIDFENSPFVLDTKPQEWKVHDSALRRAAVSSFGFSGTNAHLVVEEWPAVARAHAAAKAAYLFTLSAKTESALEHKRRDLAAWLMSAGRRERVENVSYTLNARRSHFRHRLWWVASSIDDLARQIANPAREFVSGSGLLDELGARYAAGEDLDWESLHKGEAQRIVTLPPYPFERKRYWHKERPEAEALAMFRPRWVPAAWSRATSSVSGGSVVVIQGSETGAIEAAVAAVHPGARMIWDEDQAGLTNEGPIYFLDDSAAGLSRLFRLVRKLDPARPVDLTVATRGVFEDTNPNAEALFGFCRSVTKERPAWTIRCVDIAAPGDVARAPVGFGAVRNGMYYRRILEPVSLPPATSSVFREGGTYLIAGGAGGIGLALARYLAEKYHAQSVLIGRSILTPERQREVEAIDARYLQADIADQSKIESAVRQAFTQAGALHGVFHSALELNDAPVSEMDERTFAAGLRAKIDGTIALHHAIAGIPLDFFVCFSSVQSFLGNAGQANYAAACAFQDAWARAANRIEAYPVQTINWGFWGDVGAVASEGFRRLWASQGVDSIGVEEGMEAVERVLASRHDQVVAPKADADFLANIGVSSIGVSGKQRLEAWTAMRLHQAFAAMGVLSMANERHTLAGLKQRLAVAPQHKRLLEAMISILTDAGIVAEDAGEIVVLRDPLPVDAPEADARVRLIEACMDRFPELLHGEIAATEVLFPNSSLDLVERLYQGVPETDAIGSEVARIAASAHSSAEPLRILELGAGTGATSAVVLKALQTSPVHVRYVYTDVSPTFLTHGKRRFAAAYPFIEFSLLDIEKEATAQGFALESFDIVIAANVLHATRDIRRTLRQVRALLKPSGRLILHEQTTLESFLTLTFGWLEGWWRFEDRRLPHGPLLSVDEWRLALSETDFGAVSATGGELATQHVLRAHKQITQGPIAKNIAPWRVDKRIAAAMRKVLEIDAVDLDPDRPFVDYGVDSILAQALVNTLNRDLNCGLKASDLYSYPTIRALAGWLEARIEKTSTEGTDAIATPAILTKPATFATPDAEDGRIAIIGMSGRFPGAENVDALWEMLAAGRSAIQEVPPARWNAAAYYDADYRTPGKTNSRWGGFLLQIDRFDAAFFNILPLEAEWMDPQQRLFLQEAWRALEDAGYPDRALNGKKVGVFVGCKEGDYSRLFPEEQKNPYYSVGSNSSILAARISYALNLKGPSLAVDTACSSSLVAIQLACERLRRHPDEIALAGGVAVMCTPHTHLLLGKSGMLSPDGRCKTFSHDADGFVPGEAVGVVVLKPLAAALRDGDPIRGVILAIEANQDGRTNGITAPNAESQATLEREVYAAAGVSLETIGYVETHGTGTKLGDAIEIQALSEVFGMDGAPALGSVKTNIGHTLAAAGIASLIKVLTCLERRKLVPTLNLDRVSNALGLDGTRLTFNTELQDWPTTSGSPRQAAVSSFGFSGTNVHMVVEEAPPREAERRSLPAWLIPLSAKTPGALERRIDDLLQWARGNSFELPDIAYTLLRGRSHFPIRAALVARDKAEWIAQLESIRSNPAPDGVFYLCETAAEQPALKQWGASVVKEMGQGSLSADVYRERLLAMADLYTKGYSLDWDRLLPDNAGRRISLPTYPFDGERYWVPDVPAVQSTQRVLQVLKQRWRTCPAIPQAADDRGTLVVLAGAKSHPFAEMLFDRRRVVVVTTPAELQEDASWGAITGCVDLTSFDMDAGWDEAIWTFLQKRVEESRGNGLKLLKVCHKLAAHRVEATKLEGAWLAGLYRMLGAEYRYVDSRVLDTDAALDAQLKTQILAEWKSEPPACGWCCYRGGERFAPEFVPTSGSIAQPTYPKDGVVVITGGTRGVGAAMAEYMAAKGVRKLAIMGREPLTNRARWHELSPETEAGSKIAHLRALEGQGVQVEIYTGSLNDRPALEAFRDRIHDELGPVTGILHCAGLARTDHPAFIRKNLDDVRAVCEPKIDGLLCLDEVFGTEPLQFCVLFSSVAGALPSLGVGQSDYAMANAWMDSFAQHRFQEGKRHYRSMQWPNWEALGMGGSTSAAYDATGLLSHTREEGLRLFEQAMAVDCAVTLPCVSTGELRFEIPSAPVRSTPPARDVEQTQQIPAASRMLDWLSELFARELKLGANRLDPRANFADQGIDSILMAELLRSMERALGISLPPSTLFEHTTLAALHNYLTREFPDAMKETRGADEAASAPVVRSVSSSPLASRFDSSHADIAVIGLSCRFPGASDAEDFWRLLRRGESAIGRTPEERWAEVGRSCFGGFVEGIDEFDPEFFRLSSEDAAIMDPQARLILEESARTLYDAGYGERGLDGHRVGVYIGARASTTRDEEVLLAANPILGLGQNYIAANISRCFNFAGPSLVIDTACSSALVGMHMAVRALQHGEIDYALIGGVSLLLDDTAHRLFASRKLLRPDGIFHLFDRRADGVVLGEGAGAVLLKPLTAALRDGDRVHGVIKGIAVNNNGRTAGPNAPSFQAQKDVVAAALRESGKSTDEVTAIEASGSGSMVNDLLELKSLEAVLGGKRTTCYIGSVKPNVGHLLSAAGMASFIKAVLSVRQGEHPPHLSAEQLPLYFDFEQAGFEISRKLRPWTGLGGRTACIVSFPDGGTNCCVVIEYPDEIGEARREPIPGPLFQKQTLPRRRIRETIEAEAAAPKTVFAMANGEDEDFWGLTE
jgi:amino acid adenylation domain-containing protein